VRDCLGVPGSRLRYLSLAPPVVLATVDWLVHHERVKPTIEDVKTGLRTWPGGPQSAKRKLRLLDDRLIGLALQRPAQLA